VRDGKYELLKRIDLTGILDSLPPSGKPNGMYSLVNLDVKTGELRIEKDIGYIDQEIDRQLELDDVIHVRESQDAKVVTFPKKGVKVVNPLWFDFYKD